MKAYDLTISLLIGVPGKAYSLRASQDRKAFLDRIEEGNMGEDEEFETRFFENPLRFGSFMECDVIWDYEGVLR